MQHLPIAGFPNFFFHVGKPKIIFRIARNSCLWKHLQAR